MITLYPQPVFRNAVINTPAFARRNNKKDEKMDHSTLTARQEFKAEAMRFCPVV